MMPARVPDWESVVEEKLAVIASLTPNFVLTPGIISMYMRALEPLGWEAVSGALDQHIEERDSRDPFPAIKDIRGKVSPELDPEMEATLAASRIWEAIGKYGYPNPDRARAFLMPLEWAVVKAEGGWVRICESTCETPGSILKPQWKKLYQAIKVRGLPAPDVVRLEDQRALGELLQLTQKEMPK